MVLGAKFMVSPNFDTRTQVAILVESPMPNTGNKALGINGLAPSARLLISEQLGQRYGLEANFGFSQPGLKVADIEKGQFLGTLALNGPLTSKTGFFVEGYGAGRAALTTGTTAGLYWRPVPQAEARCERGPRAGRHCQGHRHGRRWLGGEAGQIKNPAISCALMAGFFIR